MQVVAAELRILKLEVQAAQAAAELGQLILEAQQHQ
jgi:hypothetical protein